MPASQSPSGLPRRLLAIVLPAALLAGACGSAAPSPSAPLPTPEAPTPVSTPTVVVDTPTPETAAPASGAPTATPPQATPAPTATPKPRAAKWRNLGQWPPKGVADGLDALMPLVNGRILGLGRAWTEDGIADRAWAQVWDPSTRRWHAVDPLGKHREAFATVVLRDGRVMVIGGTNAVGDAYSSVYLFDPKKETWSRTGLMHTARTEPAAAVLPDGRVLVAGGHYETAQAVVPATAMLASWTPPSGGAAPPLGDVDVPPTGHALATAELWDPATGAWTKTGSMRYARTGAQAVTLADGRVLVAAATESNTRQVDGRAYTTAEIYDPATGRFTLTGPLPGIDTDKLPRALRRILPDGLGNWQRPGKLVALPDGGAVLIGWNDEWKHWGGVSRSFRFDASTSKWKEIGKTFAFFEGENGDLVTDGVPDYARAAVTALPGGRVLVAGGYELRRAKGEAWHFAFPTARAWLFDPVAGRFTKLPEMPVARVNGHAVVLPKGWVLIVGGNAPEKDEDGSWQDSGDAPVVRFVPPVP